MSNLTESKRAWEIDTARGLAVILMTAFHAVFDLNVYFGFSINYGTGFWFLVGRLSAIMFIFISGISSGFAKSPIKRGLQVFFCAMIITAVSIPIMGDSYIVFGILHFMAAAMILKGLLDKVIKNQGIKNIIYCILIPVSYALGISFSKVKIQGPMLIPLGITPGSFRSYDYYPLFPWLSIFAAGMLFGGIFYKDRQSLFKSAKQGVTTAAVVSPLSLIGRHSLIIYMLHQPALMGIFYLIF